MNTLLYILHIFLFSRDINTDYIIWKNKVLKTHNTITNPIQETNTLKKSNEMINLHQKKSQNNIQQKKKIPNKKIIFHKLRRLTYQLEGTKERTQLNNYINEIEKNFWDKRKIIHLIMETDWFLLEQRMNQKEIFTDLLEDILVIWEKDTNIKTKILITIQNLLPSDISCNIDCSKKVQMIKNSNNLDEKTKLATELLEKIKTSSNLADYEKNWIEACLKQLVYMD